MTNPSLSTKVPATMQSYYQKITQLTDAYCQQALNEEYRHLVCLATAALCRKRQSPLVNGQINTWACAIVYAVGSINFLFDRSHPPYVSAADLANAFDVSKSTAGNKAKQVRDYLKMSPFNHQWMLPSLIDASGLAWNIMVDGFIVDARTLPPQYQEIAFKKGLIPYIHADKC